jgi:hypothetical protein
VRVARQEATYFILARGAGRGAGGCLSRSSGNQNAGEVKFCLVDSFLFSFFFLSEFHVLLQQTHEARFGLVSDEMQRFLGCIDGARAGWKREGRNTERYLLYPMKFQFRRMNHASKEPLTHACCAHLNLKNYFDGYRSKNKKTIFVLTTARRLAPAPTFSESES